METNKLLAKTFLEYASTSRTEVIEVSADNKELIEAANKLNLVIPSPDLSILKTYYAEVDVANRNGAILPKQAVIDGLPTLIGKQLNWNHEGAHQICGYIINAKLEDTMIVIYAVIFKSLFPEEMAKLKEKFANKDLSVSFEIWSRDEKGNSVVTIDKDGNKIINPIIFHGCGVLTNDGELPACPKAYAQKLIAMLHLDKKEVMDNLVFASIVSKNECFQCENCTGKKGDIMESAEFVQVGNPGTEMPEDDQIHMTNDYAYLPVEDAKKLTKEQRDALKDEDFTAVIDLKEKKTGEPKKVRILPIHDEQHVASSYKRANHPKMAELMSKYGISAEDAKKKILQKACDLKMADFLNEIEPDENLIPEEEYEPDFEQAKKLTYKERKGLNDSDFALIQHKDGKTRRRFPIKDEAHVRNALARLPQAKDLSEEERKSAKAKILRRAKELNMTELLKRHETAEVDFETEIAKLPAEVTARVKELIKEGKKPAEAVKQAWAEYKDKNKEKAADEAQEAIVATLVKPEETQVTPEEPAKPTEVTPVIAEAVTPAPVSEVKVDKTISEETETIVQTYGEKGIVTEKKEHRKVTTIFSDGRQEVCESDVAIVEKYSQDQLNAAVATAKAEVEAQLVVKETEINTLKAEIETIKASKESEISSLTKQIADKDIEIASIKTQQEATPELEIGSAEPLVAETDPIEKARLEVEKLSAERYAKEKRNK